MERGYYNPAIWLFLTQDPIGLAGGVNLYAYAGNNPIAYADPFGLIPEDLEAECCKAQNGGQGGRPAAQPQGTNRAPPGDAAAREGVVTANGVQVTVASPLFGVTVGAGLATTEAGNTRAYVTYGHADGGANISASATHSVSTNLNAFGGPSEGPEGSAGPATFGVTTNSAGETATASVGYSPAPVGADYQRTTTRLTGVIPFPRLPIQTPDPNYPGIH